MFISDLHIHSKYSRATSRDCVPEYLDLWARKKGIALIGTGDFTHPAWRAELREKLTPSEEGLYALKEEFRLEGIGNSADSRPRFMAVSYTHLTIITLAAGSLKGLRLCLTTRSTPLRCMIKGGIWYSTPLKPPRA